MIEVTRLLGCPLTESGQAPCKWAVTYMLYSLGYHPKYTTYISDMDKKLKKMSLNVTESEFEALESFARKDGRTKTECVREWIRSLPEYQSQSKS
jgi:hypothetical protein